MRGDVMTITDKLVVEMCCNCGVMFALPKSLQDKLLENKGRSFYCPNGHSQSYVGETEAEKERKRAVALERQLAAANGNAKYYKERADREAKSHAATKGVLTKTKKRVANGVCPCCNRSFVDVHRHMKTKHPDYNKEN